MRWVALLRGINVGGKRIVKMDALRSLFNDWGYEQVETYIQSGNVVFESDDEPHADTLESQIFDVFGFEVPVQLVSSEEVARVVEENPFLKRGIENHSALHVTFLEKPLQNDSAIKIDAAVKRNDEWIGIDHSIYLYCPDGYGKTKLNNGFWEKKLNCKATTRNWKTVSKIYEMML